MKFRDYYGILGVGHDAAPAKIKHAYRKLARKYHPDVSKDADAEGRFKELGEAWAVLKSPEKRAAYDIAAARQAAGREYTPPGGDGGVAFEGAEFADRNASGFFAALFGRGQRHGAASPGSRPHLQGEDHHARLQIDLADSYQGARRSIALRLPTTDAAGATTLRERRLDVAIPRGICAGQHLRLPGQGAADAGGGPAGDLYLEIGFAPDPQFRADGRDVYLHLPLAPWEAALGATVAAPTPEGPVQLTIPAGSVAGRQLRMKGRGIPGTPPGDLYALLSVSLPPADTAAAQAAWTALAAAFDFDPRRPAGGSRP